MKAQRGVRYQSMQKCRSNKKETRSGRDGDRKTGEQRNLEKKKASRVQEERPGRKSKTEQHGKRNH
jgi:hypothetical protein